MHISPSFPREPKLVDGDRYNRQQKEKEINNDKYSGPRELDSTTKMSHASWFALSSKSEIESVYNKSLLLRCIAAQLANERCKDINSMLYIYILSHAKGIQIDDNLYIFNKLPTVLPIIHAEVYMSKDLKFVSKIPRSTDRPR